MSYGMRIKHCMGNSPHLHMFPSCHNHPTHWCSHLNHFLATLHHDLRAHVHFQLHLNFCLHIFHYHKLPLPDLLSKIRRLHHHFLSPANERIPKPSYTRASYTLMDVHQNLVLNRTRSPGSCHICKPVQLVLGASMSWPKSSRKLCGTIQQTNFFKKYNADSVTWTNGPLCL